MLNFDLAFLHEVEIGVLNQSVKRKWEMMQPQIETASENSSSQIVMMSIPQDRTDKYSPYAFTEQGVAMLSGVLKSDKAINMNIAIMRAFVDVRKILVKQGAVKDKLEEIMERVDEHDIQLHHLYQTMENLIDEKARQKSWSDRERIGFKQKSKDN